jgi:hypothetical protein
MKRASGLMLKVAIAALLLLAACVTSGPPVSSLASPGDDADAKTFEAKPGMGRLYVVHGDFVAKGASAEPPTSGQIWGAILLNVLAGPGASGPLGPSSNRVNGTYFLDDQELAVMGSGHYLVLDLPPGIYLLKFDHGSAEKVPKGYTRVTMVEGKVSYEKSMYFDGNVNVAARFSSCKPEDCQQRIREGQRISADWPPKGPEKNP